MQTSPFMSPLGSSRLLALLLLISLGACVQTTTLRDPSATSDRSWNVYSLMSQSTLDGMATLPEVTADEVLAGERLGEQVVVVGTVAKVCKTMGCWIEIAGSTQPLLVMNLDHEYFVPRNCEGRDVRAYGRSVVRTQSVETLRHLASDAGAAQAEIDAITKPATRTIFIADAIALPTGGLGTSLDKPVR